MTEYNDWHGTVEHSYNFVKCARETPYTEVLTRSDSIRHAQLHRLFTGLA